MWMVAQETEKPCTQAGSRELGASQGLPSSSYCRFLCGTKARVALQSQPPLGLVLHP